MSFCFSWFHVSPHLPHAGECVCVCVCVHAHACECNMCIVCACLYPFVHRYVILAFTALMCNHIFSVFAFLYFIAFFFFV